MEIIKKIFSVVLSFIFVFVWYKMSFLEITYDKKFSLNRNTIKFEETTDSQNHLYEIKNKNVKYFNYYAIEYSSDKNVHGYITYEAVNEADFNETGEIVSVQEVKEDFYLEKSQSNIFYSFIDDIFENAKGRNVKSIEIVATQDDNFSLKAFKVFNRQIVNREEFVSNDKIKIGVDFKWGGALSYYEDLNSNVQAVNKDGTIYVDSNAQEKYQDSVLISNEVNLINRNDPGRLSQQSYYCKDTIENYEKGTYMGNPWTYNPVQGGNQYCESSKIVDWKISDNEIYVKCRPLDWALKKDRITPSYMEAWYTIEDDSVKVKCRYFDFFELEGKSMQTEIPAFYCVEPLNNFVYYGGENPWTNDTLTYEPNLDFWAISYPHFYVKENWAAFVGENEDSFGIGVYVANEELVLAGVYERGKEHIDDVSKSSPTSYFAFVDYDAYYNDKPYEYEYYIASGDIKEIRNTFHSISCKG